MYIDQTQLGQTGRSLLQQFVKLLIEAEASAKEVPEEVREVVQEVHAHLYDPDLNVRYVCEHRSLTNHNVSSRFKLYMGVGIREYIERQRIEAAKLLLRYTDEDCYVIAAATGYRYVETFARAFYRQVGRTACEYRDQSPPPPAEDGV